MTHYFIKGSQEPLRKAKQKDYKRKKINKKRKKGRFHQKQIRTGLFLLFFFFLPSLFLLTKKPTEHTHRHPFSMQPSKHTQMVMVGEIYTLEPPDLHSSYILLLSKPTSEKKLIVGGFTTSSCRRCKSVMV